MIPRVGQINTRSILDTAQHDYEEMVAYSPGLDILTLYGSVKLIYLSLDYYDNVASCLDITFNKVSIITYTIIIMYIYMYVLDICIRIYSNL